MIHSISLTSILRIHYQIRKVISNNNKLVPQLYLILMITNIILLQFKHRIIFNHFQFINHRMKLNRFNKFQIVKIMMDRKFKKMNKIINKFRWLKIVKIKIILRVKKKTVKTWWPKWMLLSLQNYLSKISMFNNNWNNEVTHLHGLTSISIQSRVTSRQMKLYHLKWRAIVIKLNNLMKFVNLIKTWK